MWLDFSQQFSQYSFYQFFKKYGLYECCLFFLFVIYL